MAKNSHHARLWFFSLAFLGILFFLPLSSLSAKGVEEILPSELSNLWDQARPALDRGDKETVSSILHEMIRIKEELPESRIFPELSMTLVRAGEKALQAHQTEWASQLGQTARDLYPEYAPAYNLQARALLEDSFLKIPDAALLYIQGQVSSLHEFWTVFYFLGKLYLIGLVALAVTIALYGVILVFRVVPLLNHLFKELTSFFSPSVQVIFGLILIFLTLSFHLGWAFVIWVAVAWLYLSHKERVLAAVLIMAVFLLPAFAPYIAFFYKAEEGTILKTMVAAREGTIENVGHSSVLSSNEGKGKMAEAMMHARSRGWSQAITEYRRILEIDPISEQALVNLGNLYFHRGEFDTAILHYEMALQAHPSSAVAAFNLSQAYKEKLLFAESGRTLKLALQIDPKRAEQWVDRAKRSQGFAVVDEDFSENHLWKTSVELLRQEERFEDKMAYALFNLPKEQLLYSGGIVLLGLFILSFFNGRTPMAYACPHCTNVVCGWCKGSRFFGKMCRECRAREKAGVLEVVRKKTEWWGYIWGFLIPGSMQTFHGKAWSGTAKTFFFTAGWTGILSQTYFSFPVALSSGLQGDRILWMAVLTVVYLSVLTEFKILRIRLKQ